MVRSRRILRERLDSLEAELLACLQADLPLVLQFRDLLYFYEHGTRLRHKRERTLSARGQAACDLARRVLELRAAVGEPDADTPARLLLTAVEEFNQDGDARGLGPGRLARQLLAQIGASAPVLHEP